MTGLVRVLVIWTMAACLAGGPALAGDPVRIEICPATKGISGQDTSRVLGLLLAIGKPYGVGLAPQGCCPDPACVREAAVERKITGVVQIEFLRFGPMVRIKLRAVDTGTGAAALELKSSSASKDFPSSATGLNADVRRAITALGGRRIKVATRPRPKPKPEPKPKPDSEPEPVILGSGPKRRPGPKPLPGPVISDADAAAIVSHRSTLNWTGGSLMAGGGVMLAVGIGLLAGPFRTAMDERDQARAAWLSTTDVTLRDEFYRKMIDQDDAAKTYHTVGWVGVGLGAGLAVAGLITILLAPDLPEDAPLALRLEPSVGPHGGGAALRVEW